MAQLESLLKMTGDGVVQGASEEVGKLLVDGSTKIIPWQQILRTKNMLLPTISIESVPAPTVGKRIHVNVQLDVDEKSEVVGYQVEAFHLSVPPPVNQAVGCLAVSMAMAAIWIQMWKQSTTGTEKKTDSGSGTSITKRRIRGVVRPSPNAGSGEID